MFSKRRLSFLQKRKKLIVMQKLCEGGVARHQALVNTGEKQTEINSRVPEYMEIGQRIKDLRKRQGLTQEELADRAELTKGFISQLERDMTSPSIATLEDILQCLGTSIGEFFRSEEEKEQIVFTKDDYFVKEDKEYRNQIQWIIPNAQKNSMEPIQLHLEAKGSTYPDNPHEGEEFGYVLRGNIEIHIGTELHKAKKGDAFYYTADRTHFISSEKGADILWVTSPPSF